MIQVYTGNGKGKTTAALGLALRACGAGFKVYIGQFVKGREYCELKALKKLKNIRIEQFGQRCFIKKAPSTKDIDLAKRGLLKITKALYNKTYKIIILDEICIALKFNLLNLKEVTDLLKNAPTQKEIILTGRYAPKEICAIADLVSEITEKKHYFTRGIKARRGIEF